MREQHKQIACVFYLAGAWRAEALQRHNAAGRIGAFERMGLPEKRSGYVGKHDCHAHRLAIRAAFEGLRGDIHIPPQNCYRIVIPGQIRVRTRQDWEEDAREYRQD